MIAASRRRPFAALLVCGAIAGALITQPGQAAPPDDKPGNGQPNQGQGNEGGSQQGQGNQGHGADEGNHGQGNGQGQGNSGQGNHGQQAAPGQTAKAPAAAPPAAAAAPSAAPGTPASPEPAKSSGPAQSTGNSNGAGNSKGSGASKGSDRGQGSAQRSGDGGAHKRPASRRPTQVAPSAGRSSNTAASPAPSGSGTGGGTGTTSSSPGTRTSAGSTSTSSASSAKTSGAGSGTAPSAGTAVASTTTSPAPGAAAQQPATTTPATAVAEGAPADATITAAGSRTQPTAEPAAAAQRGRGLVTLRNQLLGIEASAATDRLPGGLLPVAALRASADVVAAKTGGALSGELDGAGPQGVGDSPITRTVRDIVERVPLWLWVALGILGALVIALGAHTLLAAARTRRLQQQRAKLMDDVGMLQAALLPAVPARLGGIGTTVAYRPADGLAAGGDFYDAFALPDGRTGLLLGDVSGHGREALAKTALVRFTVRAHLEAGTSPREALSIAGRSLDGRLGDDFATVIAAVHDADRGTLTYSSAGHPPPLVTGSPAHLALTASSAPPLDVGFPTGQRQTILPMPEGTTVALYSDGLIEARIDGEAIGPQRLTAWLERLGPAATAKELVDLVVERGDRVPDDLAAIVLHAADGATAPASRVEQLKVDVLDSDGPDLDTFLQAAGVDRAERRLVGRRVSEELAISGGVMVSVRIGERSEVDVSPIGGRNVSETRRTARTR